MYSTVEWLNSAHQTWWQVSKYLADPKFLLLGFLVVFFWISIPEFMLIHFYNLLLSSYAYVYIIYHSCLHIFEEMKYFDCHSFNLALYLSLKVNKSFVSLGIYCFVF